jgi:hypothetical protein
MKQAPERLNLRKCLGGGWSSFDDDHGTEYIRADLARPRVKPLVWDYYNVAETPFCTYSVIDYLREDEGYMWTRSEYPYHDESEENYDSIEDAKAAAQADYERRILEALE